MGSRGDRFDFLDKLGVVPEDLRIIIEKQKNSEILRKWSKLAERAESIEEFQREQKNII